MANERNERLPKYQCDGPGVNEWGQLDESQRCENLVAQTRKSKTGRHYCQKTACQSARVRAYQQDRGVASRRQILIWEGMFVHDLIHKARVACLKCGRQDALPGWIHPTLEGAPCYGTRRPDPKDPAAPKIKGHFVEAVWPTAMMIASRLPADPQPVEEAIPAPGLPPF